MTVVDSSPALGKSRELDHTSPYESKRPLNNKALTIKGPYGYKAGPNLMALTYLLTAKEERDKLTFL